MSSPADQGAENAAQSEPDPLRGQLLEAAARVIAEKGYYDTKIMDVVRAAGLSAGALYGRFESKSDLLTAAVVDATLARSKSWDFDRTQVAEHIVRSAQKEEPLSDAAVDPCWWTRGFGGHATPASLSCSSGVR